MLKKKPLQIPKKWKTFVSTGLLFFPIYAEAATSTWNVNESSTWNTPANWNPETVPDVASATAAFGSIITAPTTVTLNAPITVGTITIDNANPYIISGTTTDNLTFSTTSGSAAITVTDVNGDGSHVISSPIALSSPLSITQGSTGTLTLSGVISGSESITTASGSGPVEFSGINTFIGAFELVESTTTPTVIVISDASFGNASNLVDIVSGGSIQFAGDVGSMASPSTRPFATELMTMFMADSGTESVLGGHISQNATKTTTLTIEGPGMITLTNPSNSWNNGTIVTNGGTLGVTNNGALGIDTGLNFVSLEGSSLYIQAVSGSGGISSASRELRLTSGNNTIILDDGTVSSWGGTFEDTAALTVTSPVGALGTGVIAFTSDNDGWTGPSLTIDNVTVQISNRENLSTSVPLFLNESTLQFTASTTFLSSYLMTLGTSATFLSNSGTLNQMSGVISGGQMILGGTGTFYPANQSNTFTGGIVINNGTLQTDHDGNLGSTTGGSPAGSILFAESGGTLSFVTNSYTMSAARAVTLSAPAIFQMASGISAAFNGDITGTSSLTVMGPGNLSLGGTNSYNGGTTVNSSGTLYLTGSGQLLDTGAVDVLGTFDISGLTPTGSSTTIGNFFGSGTTNLGANTLVMGTATPTVTYSGAITGVGGGLTKQGSGTFVLSGTSNTYSGETAVNAGIFQAGATNAFSPNSQFNLANTSGVTLNVNSFSETIGSLTGGGTTGGNVTLGTGSLTLGGDDTSTIYSGVISDSGSGGSLTKTGSGVFTLTGANTYIGGTTISAGTLALVGSGSLYSSGSVDVVGTFDISGLTTAPTSTTIGNFSGSGSTNLGANTLIMGTPTPTVTYSGSISGVGGGLTKQGSGTFVLSGTSNYSGETNVNAGVFEAGAASAFSPNSQFSLANTLGVELNLAGFSQTIGSLTGGGTTGGNVALGAGSLTLGGDGTSTTYSGVISDGGSVIKQGTGIFTLTEGNTYTGGTTISAGTLALFGTGSLYSSGSVTANGTFDISNITAAGLTIGDLSGNGTVILGSKTLTEGTSNSTTFSGIIQGTGELKKDGSGVLTLSGINTYSGGTEINEGTIQISSDANLGNASGGVTFAGSGGILQMVNGITLSSSRLFTFTSSGALQTDIGESVFSGTLTGSGTLTTQGSGSLSLNGNSPSFHGDINVAAGSLIVNGNLSSSGLTTVNSGALLGGAGTLNNVSVFGILAPSDPTTFYASQFTFQPGSTYEVMISGNATDEIIASDTITILPGSTLDVFPVNPTANAYVIASAAHGVSGTFSTVINNLPRFNFSVSYSNPDEIVLRAGMVDFSSLVTAPNAKNLAVCFDAMIDLASNNQADVNLLLNVLNYLSAPGIEDAFNQFDPGVYGALNIAELDSSAGILEVYRNHMSHYWHSCPDICGVDNGRYFFWATPVGMWNSRKQSQDLRAYSGYKNTTYGIVTGVDYQCMDNLFVTVGLSYTNSQMKWTDAPVRAHYDSYAGIVGASFMNSLFDIEASLAGIYHSVRADRKVYVTPSNLAAGNVSPIDYDIKNHNNALTVASSISGSCNVFETTTHCGNTISIWPYVNLDYLYIHQFAYTEKDGSALNMHMNPRNTDLFSPETGLGFSYVKDACNFLFYVDASLGYSWECRYQGKSLTTQFVKEPGCLVELTGLFPKNNIVVPRIDIGLQRPSEQFYCFLSYKGSIFSSFTDNQITAEFKLAF